MKISDNNKTAFYVPLLLAFIIVLIPIFLTLPGQSKIWEEIQNFGHTPLTGTLALLALWFLRYGLRDRFRKTTTPYFMAFILSISLGGAIEIAQIFLPGDPDWLDFSRDILGAGAFLLFFAAFDRTLKAGPKKRSSGIFSLPFLLSGLLIFVALIPGLLLAGAYIHKRNIYPVICNFNTALELNFTGVKDAKLKLIDPPKQWEKSKGDKVGELTLQPADRPGFYIVEPGKDWELYNYLRFEIYSTYDSEIVLHLGIEDYIAKDIDDDRYNMAFAVKTGLNEIIISIDEIRNGPVDRKLDLNQIRDLYIFAINPKSSLRLFIDNIKLTL